MRCIVGVEAKMTNHSISSARKQVCHSASVLLVYLKLLYLALDKYILSTRTIEARQ